MEFDELVHQLVHKFHELVHKLRALNDLLFFEVKN